MTTPKLYFLILVCGSFWGLAIGLAASTIVYRRSLTRPARVSHRPHTNTRS